MPENSFNPEISEKEKIEPLKNDVFDDEVTLKNSLGKKEALGTGAVMTGMLGLSLYEFNSYLPPTFSKDVVLLTVFAWASVNIGAGASKFWYEMGQDIDRRINSNDDAELGFRTERLVYKRNTPIIVDGREFSKGSNFFYIKLPEILTPEPNQPPDLNLQMDLYNYAIRKSKEFAQDRVYDFVVLDIGDKKPDSSELLPNAETVQRKDILSDKGSEVIGEERNVMLLSKEQFETMSATIDELFNKVREEFNDSIFNEFVNVASIAKNKEERERIQVRMVGRLDSVLLRELESNFNALPEVVMTRHPDTFEPIRRKVFTQSLIKQTQKGLTFIQINTATGAPRYIPVDQLLKTKNKPIEEFIASKSHLKKAQLALILRDFITESDLEDLLKEKGVTRNELIEKMKNLGYKLNEKTSESKSVGKRHFRKKANTKIKTALAGAILATAGFTAAGTISTAVDIALGNPGSQGSESGDSGKAFEEQISKMEFPGLPPTGIEWEIGGTISPAGYYMTGTSHEFKDGQWIKNESIDSRFEVPTEYNAFNGKLLTLSRPILLNQFGETSFKLPIRENTLLTAIKISDPDGNLVDRTVYRLTDGSIKVVVTPSLMSTPAYVEVVSSFTQYSGNMVHAAEPLPKLDMSLLSDDVVEDIATANSFSSDVDAIEYLRADIQNNHLYSLDPPDKDKLKAAHAHEEVVNAIEDLSGCSCEICNSQLVLTSSLVSENETLNMAYGFIGMNGNLGGSESGYLKSETRHAFGIQQDGYIVDATATDPADDELTKKYIEILSQNYGDASNWNPEFEEIRNNSQKSKEQADFMKLVAGLLAGGGSLLLTQQLYSRGRKIVTAENIDKLSNNLVADVIDRKTLSKAYNFFSWLSWAKPEYRMNLTEPVKADNNVELFSKIKDTISYDKIAQYAEDPSAFERIARSHGFSFTKLDKMKLRMLANYLLRS